MDKDTIQAKALELFRKISFEKTSVSDISKACGMGKGTFYLYFKSKDEIFSAIIEERRRALEKRRSAFWSDPSVPLGKKVSDYFENLVDEYFVIKDLLFGSFENVQGRMLKEVFFKFEKNYQESVQMLRSIIEPDTVRERREGLGERVSELMELMLGKMLVFIMVHDWDDREGLKRAIAPLSETLLACVVG